MRPRGSSGAPDRIAPESDGGDARGVRRAEGIENITSQGAVPRERQHIDVHGRIDRNHVVDGSASLSETRPERVVVSLKSKTVGLVEGDRCVVDEVARIVVADGQQRLPLVLGAGRNLAFVHVEVDARLVEGKVVRGPHREGKRRSASESGRRGLAVVTAAALHRDSAARTSSSSRRGGGMRPAARPRMNSANSRPRMGPSSRVRPGSG